ATARWVGKANDGAGGFSASYLFEYNSGFGGSGETALVGDFNGDGFDDIGVYNAATASWVGKGNDRAGGFSASYLFEYNSGFGGSSETPIVGDFNGDGFDDIGVYDASRASWVGKANDGAGGFSASYLFEYNSGFGGSSETPIVGDFD
ncbi:MAG: VCBS repeat-containing protein, partial [Pseudomonadota bacterium]|nr:VCBS repeat-containing protein [Pseudomonadota bacterium]